MVFQRPWVAKLPTPSVSPLLSSKQEWVADCWKGRVAKSARHWVPCCNCLLRRPAISSSSVGPEGSSFRASNKPRRSIFSDRLGSLIEACTSLCVCDLLFRDIDRYALDVPAFHPSQRKHSEQQHAQHPPHPQSFIASKHPFSSNRSSKGSFSSLDICFAPMGGFPSSIFGRLWRPSWRGSSSRPFRRSTLWHPRVQSG